MKHQFENTSFCRVKSLPARGAWIETVNYGNRFAEHWRRSPLGGRGLKRQFVPHVGDTHKSLPARGAWIETTIRCFCLTVWVVAPRSGGVD